MPGKKKLNENKSRERANAPKSKGESRSIVKTSIDELNDYCLEKIFNFLPVKQRLEIELVCKGWQIVSQNSWYLVKKLNLSDQDDEIGNSTAERLYFMNRMIVNCGIFLKMLAVSVTVDRSIFPVIRDHCPNVVDLHLEVIQYTNPKLLSDIFFKMQKLRNVKISNIPKYFELGSLEIMDTLPVIIEKIHLQLKNEEKQNIPDEWPFSYPSYPDFSKFTALQTLTLINYRKGNLNEVFNCKQLSLVYDDLDFANFERVKISWTPQQCGTPHAYHIRSMNCIERTSIWRRDAA